MTTRDTKLLHDTGVTIRSIMRKLRKSDKEPSGEQMMALSRLINSYRTLSMSVHGNLVSSNIGHGETDNDQVNPYGDPHYYDNLVKDIKREKLGRKKNESRLHHGGIYYD